ncbi:MAG: DegT/DnrJ/EryC1/StrS family aminotransferase [Deltaproteobacteria bacterium]|nr:DegT/DnrJ/EryC1/StrS family aminotransferase [Deltaproteobacteria bacterium]
MSKVPYLDLRAQYETIKEEIAAAIQQVLASTAFVGGPFVEKFEEEFAGWSGCTHALGVSNGTAALWMTLVSLGVGPGDEVITVPNTFIATAEAISMCGARPVFVDVDEQSYTMNAAMLENAVTPRTKAVIPVHLFGQPADMDPIIEFAEKHRLHVIEDACQAHGSTYKGKPVGSIGIAGCFSFYPGKNLGAYGEAGAVVTGDLELAKKIKMLRDHGQTKKYYHAMIGWNGRMDGIQGALLSVKLKHLSHWNDARRKNAASYNRLLAGIPALHLPQEMAYARHVYHIYAVRTKNRDALKDYLAERGIDCLIHYPLPIHLQDAYRPLRLKEGTFPTSEKCAEEFLSLPMYPELAEDQIEKVSREIRCFYSQHCHGKSQEDFTSAQTTEQES